MTPLKEIGECLIVDHEADYFFRPSFEAMARIGSPQEIVSAFYHLHNDDVTPMVKRAIEAYGYIPSWLSEHMSDIQFSKPAFVAAHTVLTACCDDDISPLIGWLEPGKSGRWGFVWHKGSMPASSMLLVAQSLITHGVVGKAKVRQLQRHETGERTAEFKAFEYISAARSHFVMNRAEASQLTMTEFQMLLAAKYPDQKGFTREEYDAVANDYLKKQAARRVREKKN